MLSTTEHTWEVLTMTSDHADFYLGTGPDAVWLGSVADLGGPVEVAVEPIGLTARGVDLLTATHPALYRDLVTQVPRRQP